MFSARSKSITVPTREGGGWGWGREAGTNYGSPAVRKQALSSTMLHKFCVPRRNHYLSIVRINSFRPSPGHSATEGQSCGFNVEICSQFAVVGGGRAAKISFHLGPNLLSAALVIYSRYSSFGVIEVQSCRITNNEFVTIL